MIFVHRIKIREEFAYAVLYGEKQFEVRNNDRCYQKGDRVIFQVVDDRGPVDHELNGRTYEITYVLSGWGLKKGYVAFGIKRCDADVKGGEEE